ncbi:FAD-binding domain-containing protein 53 [Elsinoe australis]|uniref:FAD-binding domain-containing protein 53 n=1 Tax=Elsinoe australis TaxID=40998 RepID=A0A4U7AM26_9PEZI|nr:FAD-binding domain-containing protein 53 [Elsinoe australis]
MATIKVAIVGAGIAGLSSAIALRKYVGPDTPLDIRIYERLDLGDMNRHEGRKSEHVTAAPMVGAALALKDNGLHVLSELDPRIRAAAEYGGLSCRGFKFMSAGGWLLGRYSQPNTMISRGMLINALRAAVPNELIHHTSVKEIMIESDKTPMAWLEGEEKPEYVDLLIGADGIRSPTRHAIFGNDSKYQTEYSGSCAVGGFYGMNVPDSLIQDPHLVFMYGSTGFFGYSALSKNIRDKIMYWTVYQNPLPDKGQRLDLNEVDQMIRERHGHWKSSVVQTIVADAKVDSVWPIFFVPPLPSWGRDGAVVVGDAAHAMTPRSGQGAAQGIEDAQTLGILLADQLKRCASKEEAIRRTIDGLYLIRKDRVRKIHEEANTFKEPKLPMSTLSTWMLYVTMFILTKLSYFVRIFPDPGGWDARAEVARYLARMK